MARTSLPGLLGLGAALLAGLAIVLEPLQDFLLHEYNINVPGVLFSAPTVADSSYNVKFVGSLAPGVEHFQNIFYGEDTSGKNRFAPPRPFKYTKGSVVDATKSGAWCPQGTGDVLPFTSQVHNISENCLSLRIARPHGTRQDAKLPVMVYIHGGGHALGSAYETLYTPDGIVKQAVADKQPLIYVAINYRLGLFGFASSDTLIKSQETNAGLRDQRLAFEWVRDNIEKFGGDPNSITAVGQSVGASDIGLHLTSYGGTRGVPFQRAIMMSGAPGLNFNTKSDLVKRNTADIAQQVDCIKDAKTQPVDTQAIDCLREVPFEKLTSLAVAASRAARPPFGEGFFYPTYDGDYIPDRSSVLAHDGKFVKGVPIIASWVTNDGAWYALPTTATDEEVLSSFGLWLTGLSESTQQRLLELYPLEDFQSMIQENEPVSPQYYRAAQLNRDLWFTCPVLDFAWQYVKHGGVKPSQVHLLEHNITRYTPVFEHIMKVPMWRVSHLSDIPYVLNSRKVNLGDNSPSQLELSKMVSQSMARFITTANRDEEWPVAFGQVVEGEHVAKELKNEFPSEISLRLMRADGPFSVTAHVARNKGSVSELELGFKKLLERCEFINSEAVREQTGV